MSIDTAYLAPYPKDMSVRRIDDDDYVSIFDDVEDEDLDKDELDEEFDDLDERFLEEYDVPDVGDYDDDPYEEEEEDDRDDFMDDGFSYDDEFQDV